MQIIAPATTTTLTAVFRDSKGTKVSVTTPTGQVFDFKNVEVQTISSGFTEGSTGVYTFNLDSTSFTPGSYRIVVSGSLGSQTLFADGPILFELNDLSEIVPYVSPQELIAYLDLEEPVDILLVKDLAHAATTHIEQFTRRSFRHKSITSETHFVERTFDVLLNEYPVVSISSIKIDGGAQVIADFDVDKEVGRVGLGTRFSGEFVIDYVSGVDFIPQDINLAAKKVAAWFFQRRNREGVRGERLLSYNYTFKDDTLGDVREILDRYKLARIL